MYSACWNLYTPPSGVYKFRLGRAYQPVNSVCWNLYCAGAALAVQAHGTPLLHKSRIGGKRPFMRYKCLQYCTCLHCFAIRGVFCLKFFPPFGSMEAAVRKLEALVRFKPDERLVHQMRFVCLVRENQFRLSTRPFRLRRGVEYSMNRRRSLGRCKSNENELKKNFATYCRNRSRS